MNKMDAKSKNEATHTRARSRAQLLATAHTSFRHRMCVRVSETPSGLVQYKTAQIALLTFHSSAFFTKAFI